MPLIGRHGGWLLHRWRKAKLVGAVLLLSLYAPLVVLDANVATAVAAGFALIGAILALDHTDATARRARTAEYRARWDHPDLLEARIAAAEVLDTPESEQDARWEEWSSNMDTKKRLQLIAILNFWEEVSSAFNQDFLDNDWFRSDFAWELQYTWERAEWFIRKYRGEDQNALGYCEWQLALEAVRDDLDRQSGVGRRCAERALERGEDILYVSQRDPLEE